MATTTAAQRRAQSKLEYDAFLAACPSRQLLDELTNKWVSLILAALGERGSLRYNEIGRHVAGVSQKMLTQTLRSLERDGLITRTVTPSVPVKVEYELTDLGGSLHRLMRSVKDWAEAHMNDVHAARERYDAGNARD